MWRKGCLFMSKISRFVRNILGGIFATGLTLTGVYYRAKKRALNEHKIVPLFFHTINKEFFLKCILWLKKYGYSFISTEQLINHLKGIGTVPDRAVWITFDDGWKENIDNIIPVMVEHNIPVTFFISTDPVENGGVFWWSYVTKYGKKYLKTDKTIKKMRQIRENQREELIKQLADRFSTRMIREAMTIEDVKEIAKLSQVAVGCHTAHHVMMPQCTDEELDYEIRSSKEKLESWIGKQVSYFSYPEGHYDLRVKEAVKKYGFDLAATTDNSFINDKDDLFLLPRFWIRGEGFFSEAKCQMLGIWIPIMWKIQKMLDFDGNFGNFINQFKNISADVFEVVLAVKVVMKSFGI
jgi:peptidoglycan/xylan/chitin deacetylase (PgdA/CDA1 family)